MPYQHDEDVMIEWGVQQYLLDENEADGFMAKKPYAVQEVAMPFKGPFPQKGANLLQGPPGVFVVPVGALPDPQQGMFNMIQDDDQYAFEQQIFNQQLYTMHAVIEGALRGVKSSRPDPDIHFANEIEAEFANLKSNDLERRQPALEWVEKVFWPLALRKKGCLVVQQAMDVGTLAYQLQLLENLRGRVFEALQSPHANYVLQKFIKTVPPDQIQFIVEELEEHALYVARHRFGCRILQRLLEHTAQWQMEPMERLTTEVLTGATELCRHTFGNFVLQHILQYGGPQHRSVIAQALLPDIMRMAKHKLASHVVACALVHCSPEDVQSLTSEMLQDSNKFYQLSQREYGSFVARQVKKAVRQLRDDSEDDAWAHTETSLMPMPMKVKTVSMRMHSIPGEDDADAGVLTEVPESSTKAESSQSGDVSE